MSKKDVKIDDLVSIKPITDNQKVVFDAWRKQDKNLFLFGAAGTGKTYLIQKIQAAGRGGKQLPHLRQV